MNSVSELMDIYGYKYAGMCNCNGMKTLKYRNGEYEFRWRINKYEFRLRKRSVTLKPWSAVKFAEAYLESLHKTTLPNDAIQ